MLSKVAERVYWTARYLQRIENTARIISIYDTLLFDLPRDVHLSWYNLIVINSLQKEFTERYEDVSEHNIVQFMVGDHANPTSIVASIGFLRENVRTTRDVVLEETWELVNELSIYVHDNVESGIRRANRHTFLETIIHRCQQIQGLLMGNMPHDDAYKFLRLGRNIERADMTTRNLEAAMAAELELKTDSHVVNSQQIIWGTLLRALNAQQSYRRKIRVSVRNTEVISYLLEDTEQPRAIAHCLEQMLLTASQLPHSEAVVVQLQRLRADTFAAEDYTTLGEKLPSYLNDLQINLAKVHGLICAAWFPTIV